MCVSIRIMFGLFKFNKYVLILRGASPMPWTQKTLNPAQNVMSVVGMRDRELWKIEEVRREHFRH